MADINGGKFGEGLTVGAINEILIGQLSKLTKKDEKGKDIPLLSSDQMRWISALVGGVVSEATGGKAGQGGSIADSATRNNWLSHKDKEEARQELKAACGPNGDAAKCEEAKRKWDELFTSQNSDPSTIPNDVAVFTRDELNELLNEYPTPQAKYDVTEWAKLQRLYTIEGQDISKVCDTDAKRQEFLEAFKNSGYTIDEAGNMQLIATGNVVGSIVVAGVALYSAPAVIPVVSSGVSNLWEKGGAVRGQIIDNLLGNNLGKNFPVVDKWVDKTLTSIKSIDLGAASYQTRNQLFNTLKSQIDSLNNFTSHTANGITIDPSKYNIKVLEIAIPPVNMTPAQTVAFKDAMSYAQQLGIKLEVIIVK